ncbi:MAG: hypothetical protein GTO02_17555, partial [Candidatus Dadabacteria bacterium]|nr:hypothetical protein [Candidatus Dadabacteria bacterium]
MANGNYNDPLIWSTDGGVTSCLCLPPAPFNTNDTMVINHNITMTQHLGFGGPNTTLIVNASGSLYGPTFNISAWFWCDLYLYGPCTFQRINCGSVSGSWANINIYSVVEVTAQVRVNAGTLTIDGGYLYLTSGNFNVYPPGNLITSNCAKLELFGGNITNEGYIYICQCCCLTTTGNWSNEITGIVEGNGSATTTGGNMSNYNIFSIDITWCSAGFDIGMPGVEDCTTSNATCGLIMLPVDLIGFKVTNINNQNLISWVTVSEE